MNQIVKYISLLSILFLIENTWMSQCANAQTICAQTGANQSLTTLIGTVSNCPAPVSYNITSSTATGVVVATGVALISPTSGGSIVVAVINASGQTCVTRTINVVNTNFDFEIGNGCFGTLLTPDEYNAGCTYEYLIDGNWLPSNTPNGGRNYNFNSGGSFSVRMRVTCGSCSEQSQVESISVNGPIPSLTLQGDNFTELVPNTSWISFPFLNYPFNILNNSTTVIPYCISAAVSNQFQFPLQFSDNSQNLAGANSYVATHNGVNVHNASNPPSNMIITPTPNQTGYDTLVYSITSGNCTATETYLFYNSTTSQPSFSLTTPEDGPFCVGSPILFNPPDAFNLSSGTEITWIIACHGSGTAPNSNSIIHSQTWADPTQLPGQFYWTPPSGSCGCGPDGDLGSNNFISYVFRRNPCSPNSLPTISYLQVLDANANFPSDEIYCQGNSQFVWPNDGGNCDGYHTWTSINPNNVQSSTPASASQTSYSVNFNVPGNWSVIHQIDNGACGVDLDTANMCVLANPTGTLNWDFNQNQQICMSSGTHQITPTFTMASGLNFCGQNVQYSWTVNSPSPNGCVTSSPCYTFSPGTQNTSSPIINLNCSGSYTITCAVSIQGMNCPGFSETRTIVLVAPPQFSDLTNSECLSACLGQDWSPSGCIDIDPCNGGAITTSNYTINNLAYAWNSPFTFPSSGDFEVTLTASTTVNNAACENTDTIEVTVAPPPDPDIVGPSSVCANAPFSLTVNGCTGANVQGQWTMVGGSNLPGAPTNTQISNTTSYAFTCTIGECSDSDTLQVSVMAAPVVSIIPPAANPCAGGSATFNANAVPTGTYTYNWNMDGANLQSNSTGLYTVNPSNGSVIELSVDYGSCSTPPVTYVVEQATVNVDLHCDDIPNPLCTNMSPFNVPNIDFITTGLTLDSITLNNTLIIASAQINPSSLGVGNYLLKYYYHNNTGCLFEDSCSFDIVAPSVYVINGTSPMCEGSSQTLYTSPDNNDIIWSSHPCANCINANAGFFEPNALGTYTISISGDCIVPAQISIDVVPNPTGTITSPLSMCATQSIPLTGTTNPANTVTWSVDGTDVSSPLNPNAENLGIGNHQLCMHIEDNNDCVADECETISVSNAAPNPPTLNCNPVFSHYCYDMPCENIPAPTIPNPVAWTLIGQTWDGTPFSQTQICAGQGQFTQGSHELTYSFMDNIGCPLNTTCDVEIIDVTNVTIQYSDDLTICESETIQFSTTPSTAPYGLWSCTQCPTCINSNGLFTPPNVSTQTTYTIVYDDFCVANTLVVVTVNPNPSVTTTPVNALCINETTQLQSTISADVTSSGWEWNGNALSGNVFDPTQLNLNAGQQYELCFSGENQYGCADTSCFNIDIIGLPSPIVLSATGIHCLATDFIVPINNQVDYTVVFTHTVTGVSIGPFGETEIVPFLDNNGTYDYETTITSTMGCVITQNGQLTVMDDPVADISVSDYSVCNPEFDIQNNSTGDNITYAWSSDLPLDNLNNVLPSPNQDVGVPPTPTDQLYEIALSVSNLCNTSTDNVFINFVASPVADIDITSPLSNFNCAEFCVDLLALSPSTSNISQVVYSWPGFVTVNGQTSITAQNLNPPSNICFDTYEAAAIEIQALISNPCGSDSDSVILNIVPAQVNAEFDIPNFVCPGNSIPISDLSFPQGGANVTYIINPSNQGVYVENGFIVALENAIPGNYNITQNVSGCGNDSEQHSFEVGTLPNIELTFIEDIFCTGESVQFTATQTEPTQLSWNFGDGIVSVGYSYMEHIYQEPGLFNVTVTGTSATGCPGSDSGLVNVSGQDDYIILSDSIVCGNSTINARTSNPAWTSILWTLTPSDGSMQVGTSEVSYDLLNQTEQILYYTLEMEMTNLNGCISYDERIISVKPSAEIDIEWLEEEVCDLPHTATIEVGPYRSDWNYTYDIPDAESISARVTNGIYLLDAIYYSSQTITVQLRNSSGCTDEDKLVLDCSEWPFYVPNAITPDDDGLNDVFKPVFSNDPVEYKLWIYDRWGEAVFYSEDPDEHWIGDYIKNKTHFVPDGVYNWHLLYKSSIRGNENNDKQAKRGRYKHMQEARGHVTIIR